MNSLYDPKHPYDDMETCRYCANRKTNCCSEPCVSCSRIAEDHFKLMEAECDG
jgi:hypothetical protein